LLAELPKILCSRTWPGVVTARLTSERSHSKTPLSKHSHSSVYIHSCRHYECFLNRNRMFGGARTLLPMLPVWWCMYIASHVTSLVVHVHCFPCYQFAPSSLHQQPATNLITIKASDLVSSQRAALLVDTNVLEESANSIFRVQASRVHI